MKQEARKRTLDSIIDQMIDVVENSKDEVFKISEDAQDEYNYLVAELEVVKERVNKYNNKGDELEEKVRQSRQHLARVSKHFDHYSEREIRDVYEKTHAMQTRLAVLRQEESSLRKRRDELDGRLLSLSKTVDRAENLVSKISVILPYLQDEFRQVNDIIQDTKQKQQFNLKIISAQEEERRKISREMHDGPAQMMANILLRSELIERAFTSGDVDKAINELKSIRKMVRTSLYEVRRIIYDLRPMALDDLGLLPTIKKHAMTLEEYHKIEIDLQIMGEKRRLSQDYEVALFRLIQESLQNAVKHSKASKVKVEMKMGREAISIFVADNGIGFDFQEINENSFGLVGMGERVEMLGGTISIQSEKGKGTQIDVKIPYMTNKGKE